MTFRVLDPACGSGHFLLYAFDMFARMYVEAWELGLVMEGATWLRETYKSLSDLERAIPRMIVENNLYGIDINHGANRRHCPVAARPRNDSGDFGHPGSRAPRIRRTGIIVAEPHPRRQRVAR